MKVLFIGCVESSYFLLNKLLSIHADIVGVITKKKSDFNSDFVDLSLLCEQNAIPCIYGTGENEEEQIEFVERIRPDIGFCFGWSHLLSKDFMQLLPQGFIGYHPAELPNNRGRHPVIWALALGLKQTASTFFMLNADADTGDIVSQRKVEIDYSDNARSLYNKLISAAEIQIEELWQDIVKQRVNKIPQDMETGNSWRKRNKEDGRIDWRMSGLAIYNLVRALTKPYAGAHFVYKGQEIKVWSVKEVKREGYDNIEPGKVLAVYDNGEFEVKAYDNIIRVIEADKHTVSCGDYL
ncbi:MAG: methionyl-tRNA formyltransferase [Lachnospiraceae bacterium]|nr:methionyl-tRNA formyltransferase [Lachnospiraceae bacterium]